MDLHTVYLAGGCFWCTEAVFERVRGVHAVQSGYANGHVDHPRYEQVCTGSSGHAEVVRVEFDADTISLPTLLQIFFATHDPTTPNRQGNDVGPQYRSGIYSAHPEHLHTARAMVQALEDEGVFAAPLVTEIAPLTVWWPAEEYHQNYYQNHPGQGYCAYVVAPKVHKLQQVFAQHLK